MFQRRFTDTQAFYGFLLVSCVLLKPHNHGAVKLRIEEFKMPNTSDFMLTESALESENNATLKYILQKDLLYCPKDKLCAYSRPSNLVLLSCCVSCSCQLSCQQLDNCCPDILKTTHSNNSVDAVEKMRCIHPQLLDYLSSGVDSEKQFLMISTCDYSNDTDLETTLKCERTSLDYDDLTMDRLMPVTIRRHTYKNMYCAMCNKANLSEVKNWNAEVRCPKAESVTGYSTSNLIQNILAQRTCNLIFVPSIKHFTECNIGLIRKCNVTGKWIHYDAFVEKACISYTHVYRGIYRNVFCFMCNEEDGLYIQCSNVDLTGKESIRLGSFNALIEYNSMVEEQQDDSLNDGRCPRGEIYDYSQESCKKLHCSSPYAVRGMECKTVYTSKLYTFKMYLRIYSSADNQSDFNSYIEDNPDTLFIALHHIIKNTVQANICELELFVKENDFHNQWLLHLDLRGYYTHEFIENLLSTEGTVYQFVNFSLIVHFVMNESNIILYERKHYAEYYYNMHACLFNPVAKFSRQLICPFVIVPRNGTFVNSDDNLCYIQDPQECFSKFDFDCDDNVCKICADKLLLIHASSRNRRKENDFETFLSFSCSMVSMTSLLITIITYCCFSSLRSLPGLNTMGLSISLLTSHGLYSFGMYQTQTEALCIGLGILTHFSWLNSFTWMNVCSLHMYRVFGLIKLHTSGKYRTFMKYTVYSILLPTAIVTSHILLSLYISNTVGYGGHACYISDYEMILYFFAVPLSVGLATNIILFILVVIKTSRLPNLSKDMNIKRNTFAIYIKLTSLTGMTWLFGFLYQHTDVKELSYVHIILNGIQGLYVLIAFSFNARVRRLYKMSLTSKDSSSKSQLKKKVTQVGT